MPRPVLPVRFTPRPVSAAGLARQGVPALADAASQAHAHSQLLFSPPGLGRSSRSSPDRAALLVAAEQRLAELTQHPDERVPLGMLRDTWNLRLALQWYPGARLLAGHAVACAAEVRPALLALGRQWERLVALAVARADAEKLEVTPLLDGLLAVREASLLPEEALDWARYPLGFQTTWSPQLSRVRAWVSGRTSSGEVIRFMGFKSRHVRATVLQHAAALQDPEAALHTLTRLDAQGIRLLMSNPALSPASVRVFQEWGLFQVATASRRTIAQVRELFAGLADGGHKLADDMRLRCRVMLRSSSRAALRDALALVPDVCQDPVLRAELLRTQSRTRLAHLAAHSLDGEWLSLVQRLHEAGPDDLVATALERTPSRNVRGVARSQLAFLLRSSHRGVRLAALRLAAGERPSGVAPAPPVEGLPPAADAAAAAS